MAEVFQFPASIRLENKRVQANQAERKKLADWFRALATHIEGNDVEHAPLAAMIVLSSADGDEVLNTGYQRPEVSLHQAAHAANRFSHQTFPRRGGNFYDRRK